MKCEEVYAWLQAYLDTEVTPEEERMVERHIRACSTCRRRLVELAQTIRRLEKTQRLTPGQEFTRKLMDRLQQERTAEREVSR